MRYWLFKTEPDSYSLDDLANEPNQTCDWDGIRNYQARNRLRDEVQQGDLVLIYHSSCRTPAIVGLAEVTRAGHADPSQFTADSPLFDPKASPQQPRWFQVSIQFLEGFPHPVTLKDIKADPALQTMELVSQSRLSIQHVTHAQFDRLYKQATHGRQA